MKKLSRFAALSCAAVLSGIFAPFGLNDQKAVASGTSESSYPVQIARRWIVSLQNPPVPPAGLAVAGGLRAPIAIQGDVAVAPATQPACDPGIQGKLVVMGEAVAPSTQPTTQPVEKK